jgi:hypothetical protein
MPHSAMESEAPRPESGASRARSGEPKASKGDIVLIVPLDPVYPASAGRGTCRSLRSGRGVGENLIADTSACPSTTKMSWPLKRLYYDGGKLPLPITTSNYPLDKIFGDIPARSEDPIHASVRHFHSNFSKQMIWFRSFLDLSEGCSSGYPNGIIATTRTDSGIVRIFLTSSSLKAPIQHVPNPSS